MHSDKRQPRARCVGLDKQDIAKMLNNIYFCKFLILMTLISGISAQAAPDPYLAEIQKVNQRVTQVNTTAGIIN